MKQSKGLIAGITGAGILGAAYLMALSKDNTPETPAATRPMNDTQALLLCADRPHIKKNDMGSYVITCE